MEAITIMKFKVLFLDVNIDKLEEEREYYFKQSYFAKLVFLFTIGCFAGWLWETVLSFFQFGKFYSRVGVLYGPLNPIYGIGVVIMVLFLRPIKKWYNQLIIGAIAGGSFEYIAWAMSMIVLNSATWNYSSPFTITIGETTYTLFKWAYWGGTSLFHSFFWGLCGLACIRLFFPPINKLVDRMSLDFANYIAVILTVLLAIDIFLTCAALLRQMTRNSCATTGKLCFKDNIITIWLDEHYPDSLLEEIFQNLKKYD